MTRNPYAHPMDDEPVADTPSRISGLAVSSLIFSLICCIPGAGLIGTILGGAGVIAISKSEGRLSGRTLAFVGVLLGVLCSAFWIAIGVGARQGMQIVQARMVEPSVATMQALGKQDWAGAAKLIDPKSGIGEAELKDFAARLEAAFGAPVGAPPQISIEHVFGAQATAAVEKAGMNALPIPVPVQFKNGTASVVLVLRSQDAFGDLFVRGGTLNGQVRNFGVVGAGKEVWLVDPLGAKKPAAGN